jgi:hypothetical protein
VSYLLISLAPMDFGIALLVLAAVHGATLFALWKVLELLRPSASNVVLLAWYGLNASLGSAFLWFTAGLHRLPCSLFSVLTTYYFLRFRRERRRRDVVFAALSNALALGFYEKGALVVVHLLALELSLFDEERSLRRRGNFLAIAALVPVVAAYFLLWHWQTDTGWHRLNVDPWSYVAFLSASLPIFAGATVGLWQPQGWIDWLVVISPLAGLVCFSVVRSRLAAVAWVSLALCVALHMLVVASSGLRQLYFGVTVALEDRYYLDAAFLVPIFAAVALRAPAAANRARLPSWAAALTAAIAIVALVFFPWTSEGSIRRIQATDGDYFGALRSVQQSGHASAGNYYVLHEATRTYVHRLHESLASLPKSARRPLGLVDTPLPPYVVPWGDIATKNSELLLLMGEAVRVGEEQNYVVSPFGFIFDVRPWRRALSRDR